MAQVFPSVGVGMPSACVTCGASEPSECVCDQSSRLQNEVSNRAPGNPGEQAVEIAGEPPRRRVRDEAWYSQVEERVKRLEEEREEREQRVKFLEEENGVLTSDLAAVHAQVKTLSDRVLSAPISQPSGPIYKYWNYKAMAAVGEEFFSLIDHPDRSTSFKRFITQDGALPLEE